MNEAIRQRARELGFDDCRITTAEAPASALQFQQWLAQGQHGEMAYLQRNAHRRTNPQTVLPGAKSIITLAVSYGTTTGAQGKPPDPEPDYAIHNTQHAPPHHASRITHRGGLVARYARYSDYHNVL